MKGTRFLVVRLKEVIRTAIFAVLGLIILFGLIHFFLGVKEQSSSSIYRNGTYYGSLTVGNEGALVAVTVEKGKISQVSLEEQSTGFSLFYPQVEKAAQNIGEQVVKQQNANVELDQKYIYSSAKALGAVQEGVQQAMK